MSMGKALHPAAKSMVGEATKKPKICEENKIKSVQDILFPARDMYDIMHASSYAPELSNVKGESNERA